MPLFQLYGMRLNNAKKIEEEIFALMKTKCPDLEIRFITHSEADVKIKNNKRKKDIFLLVTARPQNLTRVMEALGDYNRVSILCTHSYAYRPAGEQLFST